MKHSSYILGRCPDEKALAAFVDGPALAKTFGLDFVDHDFVDYLFAEPLPPKPAAGRKVWDAARLKRALKLAAGKGLPDANALVHLSDPLGPECLEIYEVKTFRRSRFMFIGPFADGTFDARPQPVPQLAPFARYRALAEKHLGKTDDDHVLKVAAVDLALRVDGPDQMIRALIKNDPGKWKSTLGVNDVLTYVLEHDQEAWAIRTSPDARWGRVLKALQSGG